MQKKNHLQVVFLLLINHADFRIKDSNGCMPKKLSSDRNIKKLIKKYFKCKNNSLNDENKYPFLKLLPFIPPKPSKTRGPIQKTSRYFASFKNRFIEVDPIIGSFRRYAAIDQFPNNPLETIPLIDVIHCKKLFRGQIQAIVLKYFINIGKYIRLILKSYVING